jgi:hypothetical protein
MKHLGRLERAECSPAGLDICGEVMSEFAVLSAKQLILRFVNCLWHEDIYGLERRYTVAEDEFTDLGYPESIEIFPDYDLAQTGQTSYCS